MRKVEGKKEMEESEHTLKCLEANRDQHIWKTMGSSEQQNTQCEEAEARDGLES